VEEALERGRRLRGAGAPPIEQDSPIRRFLKSSLFYLPLAGFLGALAGWAIIEPGLEDYSRVSGEIVAVHTDVFVLGEDDLTIVIEDREVVVNPAMTSLEPGADGQDAFKDLADLRPGTLIEAVGEVEENRLNAWAIRPATPERARATGSDLSTNWAMFFFFPLIAACIAFALTLAEGLSSRNWLRMLERTGLGVLLASVLSTAAMIPAGMFITLGQLAVVVTRGDATVGYTDTGLFFFAASRSIAWCCIGAALGVGLHLVRSTRVQLRNSVIGGALGGALGGIFFDPVQQFFLSDSSFQDVGPSRLVGVAAVGLCIGLFMALVDRLAREAWIRVRTGPLAGKAFVLYRSPSVIGSAPQSDIYLMKDPGIDASHAALHRVGNRFEIEDLGSREGTRVAGEEVRRRRLTSGDQIVLGATVLEFEERAKASGEET